MSGRALLSRPRAGTLWARSAIITTRSVALTGALALVATVSLGAALIAGRPIDPSQTPKTAALSPIASPWVDLIGPTELLRLDSIDFAEAPRTYAARRHRAGGGRQDVMTLGRFGEGAYLRLSLYRHGGEAGKPAPMFAELARQAAEAGLSIARIGLPDLLPTRFGAFEIADIGLRGGSDTPPSRPTDCGGFRLVLATPGLTISGLACGGATLARTRDRLGCLLNHLDLAPGGDDQALTDLFTGGGWRRDDACGGAPERGPRSRSSTRQPSGHTSKQFAAAIGKHHDALAVLN